MGAGRHRIVVSKPGFVTITRVVEIASAEVQKVPIELLETKPLAPAPPPVLAPRPAPVITAPPPRHPPSRTLPTIGWAVTGGLAAGAVVTGILALGASSSLKTERTSGTATRDDLEAAKSKTQTLALVTDILTGCAVVTGGLSLSHPRPRLILRHQASSRGPPQPQAEPGSDSERSHPPRHLLIPPPSADLPAFP